MSDQNQNDDQSNTNDSNASGAGDDNSPEFLKSELERFKVKYGLEKEHRKNAETKVSEFERTQQENAAAQAAAEKKRLEDNAKNSDNSEDLRKSMQELRDNDRKTFESELEQYKSALTKVTAKQAAQKFVSDEFGKNGDIMLPNFESRFVTELNGTEATVSIKGPDGKASAMTIEDLKAEVANDSKFSPFRVTTNANGGGANGGSSNGGNGGARGQFKGNLKDAKPSELVAHIKSKQQ